MIHPFHPRCGDTLEVIEVRNAWGQERVYYRCSDRARKLCSMPLSWTDAGEPDLFAVVAEGRCAFRTVDLLRLSELLAGLTECVQAGDKKC